MRYTLADIKVNLTTGIITKEGKEISVRAKTLLVLKHLIAHKKDVVTKQTLLNTIWHDVVVQDQVLVQSVKEIRDILGSQVIKTYPRQGYQWTGELTPVCSKKTFFSAWIAKRAIVSYLILLTLMLTFFIYQDNKAEKTFNNEITRVAFLPVKNDMPDDIHDWVPLKGTQYLNQGLQQQSSLVALNTKALHTLLSKQKVTQLTSDPTILLPGKLGVDLIVETRLLGYPQDFQLFYTFYLPHSVERGIAFADTVEKTFDQLIEKIALRFGDFTPGAPSMPRHDFSNEAFTRGIELYLLRKYDKASAFFISALETNPELLAARRYLAACYINRNDVEQGLKLMKINISHAQRTKAYREEIRSYLLMGVSLMNWHEVNNTLAQDKVSQAQDYIELAKTLAQKYHDSLFIAYAHEELGKIQRLQKNYRQAIKLQQTALAYHQSFRGSYGQTKPLIELARIANEQGNTELAREYFKQATAIADKNGVTTNQVAILIAQADIKKAQGLLKAANEIAEKALALATKTRNHLLVERVKAWFENNHYYEIN